MKSKPIAIDIFAGAGGKFFGDTQYIPTILRTS